MKTYLITGGAGFIGSNFINWLVRKYDDSIRIINLDKLTYAGNLKNLNLVDSRNNYVFINGDICNDELVNHIFRLYKPHYVVNFAAESHVDRSIENPQVFIKTNICGTQTLIDASMKHGIDKYVQISTDEVYGSLGTNGYFSEYTPLDPHSPYSASKAAADMIVKAYYDTYKLPINITRCSNNYGPYQFPEKLIPLIINNCLNGKILPVYGTGENIRDWLYVEDHCKAIDIVLRNGVIGEVYNIGGNNEKQNIEIINSIIYTLRDMLPAGDARKKHISKELIRFVEDRKGHDRRYAIDASKIKNDLGWLPDTTFESGIIETIKWYLENENWLYDITSGEYQNYYEQMYSKRLKETCDCE